MFRNYLKTAFRNLLKYKTPEKYNYFYVRLNAGDPTPTLASLERTWHALSPDYPFSYTFLDERLAQLYGSERRFGETVNYFTLLALLVACVGLFGLASFAAERRTKEIGVRKVLGATAISVTGLISKEFLKLVMLANLIAWPIAWYVLNKWLQNFAYRIELSWWVFALAGGLALVIALLTVSTQAIKAALANPVQSLRYE